MQNVADGEGNTPLKPAAIGEDFDQAFLTVRGVDGDEAMVERWSLSVDGCESEAFECSPQGSGDQHSFMVVNLCEQVDVVGEAGDEAVRDHRPAAGEGKGAGLG